MCWIICVAVVVIFYFFIHFKIRNEVNEIEASIERTKTFVIMGNESNEMDVPIERKIRVILSNESNEIDVSKDLSNESNEIDVSKDLSISPSCNFQITGKEKSVLKRRHLCPLVPIREDLQKERNNSPIREDLQKERNNSLNKCHNIDFGIINKKNKEDMNCFRNHDRLRQKTKADRLRQKEKAYRLKQKKEADRFRQKFEEVKMGIAEIVARRYRDIKLKTKNMPATKPICL